MVRQADSFFSMYWVIQINSFQGLLLALTITQSSPKQSPTKTYTCTHLTSTMKQVRDGSACLLRCQNIDSEIECLHTISMPVSNYIS